MGDLALLALFAITMGLIVTTLGIALLDLSLKPLDFNADPKQGWAPTHREYYDNPLARLKSKWFHYRPKGSVILSKAQWAQIEKNIGIKVAEAKTDGEAIGYKKAIVEIQDMVREEKSKVFPTSPYAVLGVSSTTPSTEITVKYQHMIKIYDPRNFVDLDKAFIELAEIRTAQLKKAWQSINFGVGRSKGDI